MLEDFDRHVSIFSESLARRLGRRKMVGTAVGGLFTAIAAATVGQLTNVGDAFARSRHHHHHTTTNCTCDYNWTRGSPCDSLHYPCPPNGCPSGCSTCMMNDCGGGCPWNTGSWVSCSNQGPSGQGYQLCVDCKCPDCNHFCSCLSSCINC
jgi:hypothetical protein